MIAVAVFSFSANFNLFWLWWCIYFLFLFWFYAQIKLKGQHIWFHCKFENDMLYVIVTSHFNLKLTMNPTRSTNKKSWHTIRGGSGQFYSIQLEITPLKTKKKIKKPGPYRSHTVDGKRVSRYIYLQDWTCKLRGRYSDKFLRMYGNNSSNRNWGQISCRESNYEKYLVVIEQALKNDIKKMIKNSDGVVIRRKRDYIQEIFIFKS